MTPRQPRAGLTLVEALVVIAVIGVLAGLLLPAVQAARAASQRAACSNHLRQIGLAAHAYHDLAGQLPGVEGVSWSLAMLPQLEQPALLSAFNFDLPPTSSSNATVHTARLDVFTCPGEQPSELDDGGVVGNYALNSLAGGRRLAEFRDGLSATLLGFDLSGPWSGRWVIGPQYESGLLGPETHPGGRPVLFADGSVRSAWQRTSGDVVRAWMTPAGGEIHDPPL